MSDTLDSVVTTVCDRLADTHGADAWRFGRRLIAAVLDIDGAVLIAAGDMALPSDRVAMVLQAVERAALGEPISRIVGRRGFWDFDLEISADTLDPRSDTETVVEAALCRIPADRPATVADLGTGSGCLLLAVLAERPLATGIGIDLSEGAVHQARRNAVALDLDRRAKFIVGDWADALGGSFDVVLSNPPYIRTDAMAALDEVVRRYDPPSALDGGPDGLQAYRRLMPGTAEILKEGGMAVVEIGFGQAFSICRIFHDAGLTPIAIRSDLSGIQRAVIAKKCWNSDLSTVRCRRS